MALKIRRDTLTPKLREFDVRVNAGIELAMEWAKARSESQARTNARWTDRTGNARNGLRASYEESKNKHTLNLFHTMPYGIFLETRFSGRYAIIMPTLENISSELPPVIAEAVKRALTRG